MTRPESGSLTMPRGARFLEQALMWNIVIHALALVSAALVLLRAMPGGLTEDDAARVAFIADHPTLWRLGWVPWHLCALIDLITGIALVWTRWIPRGAAWLTLLVTVCAVIPEQTGEIGWVTHGVTLARQAHASGDPGDLEAYLAYEKHAFFLLAVVGASLYILMALGWTWCFVAAGAWNRTLTILTPFTWGSLSIASIGLFLPEGLRPSDAVAGAANGIGFVLMEIWLWLVLEEVLRRSRRDEKHGRLAPWRHPTEGVPGNLANWLANSRAARAFGQWLPLVSFRSDIRDVIYCNYLVEADTIKDLVPFGLELQRLGSGKRWAMVSFLSYRHGHFGPSLLGPLRRLLPSPVQTNWRTYVRDPESGTEGIYFFTNAISSTLHALAARLLSEGMPMHALQSGIVRQEGDDAFTLILDKGKGSAPDARADLRPGAAELTGVWAECFDSYRAMLAYTVPQDRALSTQPWVEELTGQEINLGIPLESCEPLTGTVVSQAAHAIVGDAPSLCFRVPSVAFLFNKECRRKKAFTEDITGGQASV